MTAAAAEIDRRRGWIGRILGPVLLVWFPGRNDAGNLLKLSLVSLLFTGFFLFVGDPQYPGGAQHFTGWADAIANGGTLALDVTQRTVGYPLLIWLTGYPYTGSLIPLILVQALFSFLFPLLVYLMVAPASRVAAFVTAMVLILSLSPYVLMKFVHHDQLHIFLLLLTAAGAVSYCRTGRPLHLYLTTAAAIACTFARPISLLVLPIVLVAAVYFDWVLGRFRFRGFLRKSMHFAIAIAVFAGAIAANNAYRRAVFGLAPGETEPSYTAAQLFYGPYVNSVEFGIRISPDLGPNTAALYDHLRERLGPVPAENPIVRAFVDGAPAGDFVENQIEGQDLDQLIDSLFAEPNAAYFQLLTGGFEQDQELSSILMGSIFEIAWNHPLFIARYAGRSLWHLLFDPGWGHSMWNTLPLHRQASPFIIDTGQVTSASGRVTETAYRELAYDATAEGLAGLEPLLAAAARYFSVSYRLLPPLSAALMLFGLAASLLGSLALGFRRGRRFVRGMAPNLERCLAPSIVLTMLVLYHGAIIALTVEPFHRYELIVLPLQVTAAGVGAFIALDMIRAAVRRMAGHAHSPLGWKKQPPGADARARIAVADFAVSGGGAVAVAAPALAAVFALYAAYLTANIY